MRITDNGAGTRPADEIILSSKTNLLVEMKRTKGDRFELNMLRSNQRKGLHDFDCALPNNIGLIFVSFLSDQVDEAYAIRLLTLERYFQQTKRFFITRRQLQEAYIDVSAIRLPRVYYHDPINARLSGPAYDLSEVIRNCQFL